MKINIYINYGVTFDNLLRQFQEVFKYRSRVVVIYMSAELKNSITNGVISI